MPYPAPAARIASRSRVSENGCHEWTGKRYSNGYGAMMVNKRWCLSHRVAWELQHGAIPKGMCICHRCDNPCCVNVSHLFMGTAKDNAADMRSKGRGRPACGEQAGLSKLTEGDVLEIRRRAAAGQTQKRISEDFDVSRKQISVVVNRKQWAHL